jgi:hypothetical protein
MCKWKVESQISSLTPDSRPLKVRNRPNLITCRWCVTYHWKDLDEGYNFVSDLIWIEGMHTKLWAPKVTRVPTLGISGFPLRSSDGSLGTKCHLGANLLARHKVYYNWRTPKSRGETHLGVSQSQVAESWDLEARSRLPTLERGRGLSWEPRD